MRKTDRVISFDAYSLAHLLKFSFRHKYVINLEHTIHFAHSAHFTYHMQVAKQLINTLEVLFINAICFSAI